MQPQPEPKHTPRWGGFSSIPEATAKDLRSLDSGQLRMLRVAIEAITNATGSDAPAEEFIDGVLMEYAFGTFTPETIADRLEEFQNNFGAAVRTAERFQRDYGWYLEHAKRKAPEAATSEALTCRSELTRPSAYRRNRTSATEAR